MRLAPPLVAALAAISAPPAAAADAYPTRPVRLIAPFQAGGGADTVARLVAQKLAEALSQQVIVDNRPGASNVIGTEIAARATPDGHTLLIANSVHTINAGLFSRLPYDPINDFTAISMIATTPFVLIVTPSLPAKSVRELVALAKSKPGQINYASAGNGTAAHLAAELFRLGAGIDIVHVPYKGVAQALIDTVAGATQIMIPSPLTAMPQVKAGKVRALAVTTARRSAALPDLPTMQEAGVPGYEFSSWYGLLAPRGVPAPVVATLNRAVGQSVQHRDLSGKLAAEAAEAAPGTAPAFAALLRDEVKRYKDLVRKIGLKVD